MVNLLSAFKVKPDANGSLPPKETVNSRIIALALFGASAAMLFGYDLGFIGGVVTLPAFKSDFHLNTKSAAAQTAFSSNVVSVFQAGAVGGAMVSSFIANRLGRRISLFINLVIYIIGAAFMTGASGSAGEASTMIVPVYVAECSPPHIRGRLVGMYEVGVQFGTMIGFWIPYGILKTQTGTPQWRIPFAVQLIPSGACLIALFFLRETPRFIAKQSGESKALHTLAYFRGLPEDHDYVHRELDEIMEQVEIEKAMIGDMGRFATIKKSFGRRNLRRLLSGMLVMIFFQMAGTNAVNYYSPVIFQSLGLSSSSASLFATGVYGVIRFVATLIAMSLFTDRFGRKPMIVTGGSIMAICMWIVGALSKTSPAKIGAGMSGPQLGSIILIYIWAVAFCFSYAGIPWIFCSEIFPLDIRTFCMAICTSTHWAFNLMLAKTTPYMIQNLGGYGIYFVFAACTTVGAIWEFFYMPETRGKTLEEIEAAFGNEIPNDGLVLTKGAEGKMEEVVHVEQTLA
ncbi:hypothetical protein EHS25_001040 [Saitozyma podzolica]|uniref:Quinate transporter n=1 Tax=Saitozyma podzolica TaxID=1890683 RepID=A0A427YH00_9TREE|nr:hypothetical protein EHS25_001040 [Saitozyma podzolica]